MNNNKRKKEKEKENDENMNEKEKENINNNNIINDINKSEIVKLNNKIIERNNEINPEVNGGKQVNNNEESSSDEEKELQSYINNYFSVNNIQKYKSNINNKINKANSKNNFEDNNQKNPNLNDNNNYGENENENNNYINNNKNTDKSKLPIRISGQLFEYSRDIEKERDESVNNLKNLIRRINFNQSSRQNITNDNDNDSNEINDNQLSLSQDIPLSYNSVEYDNYLSRTIENSKKSINLPKVSDKHKNLYIQECLKLCRESNITKEELYELLHQCNGSIPATKSLLKSKRQLSEEKLDPKTEKWIWSKREDQILLTSKDERQLKKMRLMKGNKSVRYRELYLEAKELYHKVK